MKTKDDRIWNSFCTTAWFLTGEKIRHKDFSSHSNKIYYWYLDLCTEMIDVINDNFVSEIEGYITIE